MEKDDLGPGIIQRGSRSLLFKIRKDKQVFPLDGCQAIFVMKLLETDLDTAAILVKRSAGYPAIGTFPAGPGDNSQISFVSLPVPGGGSPQNWGLKVILKPTDITKDLVPGQYFVQIDIIPVDPTDRFPAVQGFLTILPTGITDM